jgi:lipid II:glycine glycyltransferase (peptidoglycan interpeptide bridge formation enzyme)
MGMTDAIRKVTGNGRVIEVRVSDDLLDNEWDDFVVAAPDGHHEQTSRWGQVRGRYGWRIVRCVLRENGKIVAGVQAQLRPLGRFGNGAYVTYGPCLGAEDPWLADRCVRELKRMLKRLRIFICVVELPYLGPDLIEALKKNGFIRKPHRLQPHSLEYTTIIDVTRDPEEILAGMRGSTRKNIKAAIDRDVVVVEGGEPDLDTFRRLMLELCERRKISPNPPQADFFHYLWELFVPRGWVKLFIAQADGEPVSAVIAFPFRNWFRAWKIGWSGEHRNLKPNEALFWAMIRYAHQHGFRYFDFVGIDAQQAKAVLAGTALRDLPPSHSVFKLGFGGQIWEMPGAFCYFPNPLLRLALSATRGKILDSELIRRMTGRFSRKLYSSGREGEADD